MTVIQKPPRQAAKAAKKQTEPKSVCYKKATYQDVIDAPPNKVAEVVDGRLYTHPRPASPHTRAGSALGGKLFDPYDQGIGGPGGWWILDEPELHFGTPPDENILVPDLAGWRRERMPEYPKVTYFTLVPDWTCEILSPSTRALDLGPKRDIYAREGVAYLWFIDPVLGTLEAFKLHNGQWALIATVTGDAPISVPPFEGLKTPLNSLWG